MWILTRASTVNHHIYTYVYGCVSDRGALTMATPPRLTNHFFFFEWGMQVHGHAGVDIPPYRHMWEWPAPPETSLVWGLRKTPKQLLIPLGKSLCGKSYGCRLVVLEDVGEFAEVIIYTAVNVTGRGGVGVVLGSRVYVSQVQDEDQAHRRVTKVHDVHSFS